MRKRKLYVLRLLRYRGHRDHNRGDRAEAELALDCLDDLLGVLVHYDYLERVVRPLELQHVAVSGEVFHGVLLVAVDYEREVLNLLIFPAVYRDRLVVHVDVVLLAYVVKAEAKQDEQDDERCV